MRINIGEIEVNYELTEDEKNILTNEEQEYYKFIKETEMAEKCLKLELQNQLCCYNGEKLTLCALAMRFRKSGVEHPQIEAKKYLL